MSIKAQEVINDLKLPGKFYVGFSRRYADSGNLLGFATPMDDTKAFQKRKETVDNWRDKDAQPIVIENEPIAGFTFKSVESRYRSDNKWFRVWDPRGFDLEISTENLLHLIGTSVIMQGKLIGYFVWARRGSNNWLLSSESENYRLLTGSKEDPSIPRTVNCSSEDCGKVFRDVSGSTLYQAHGKFFVVSLQMTTAYSAGAVLPKKDGQNSSYYDYYTRRKNVSTFRVVVHKKKICLFSFKSNSDEGIWIWNIRKSGIKDLIEIRNSDDMIETPEKLVRKPHEHLSVNGMDYRTQGCWFYDDFKTAEIEAQKMAKQLSENFVKEFVNLGYETHPTEYVFDTRVEYR